MTLESIEEMLGLPDGVRLMGLRIDVMRGVVEFRFDGRGLPPCAEGAEPMFFESLRKAWEYRMGRCWSPKNRTGIAWESHGNLGGI